MSLLLEIPDPEPLLPGQLLSAPVRAEHRLMFAVLIDAINLAAGAHVGLYGKGRARRREAVEWISSDVQGTTYGWSFRAICTELELDPFKLRKQIFELEALDLRGKTPKAGDCGGMRVVEVRAMQ